jgi:Ca2+-binding RTX toxin-like protein
MEQFRAILQRSSADPVATFLSRSDFVAITEGTAPPPATNDDFADTDDDTSAPIGLLDLNASKTGIIGGADANDTYGDKDVFSIFLAAGETYEIQLRGTAGGGESALPSGIFSIRNENFTRIEDSGTGPDVYKYYQAEYTGLHYVRVGTGGSSSQTGGYTLTVRDAPAPGAIVDDWADSPTDAGSVGSLAAGKSRTGALEASGDKDVFAVTLHAGNVYTFSAVSEAQGVNGPLDTIALSLRGPNTFPLTALRVDDGTGRAAFAYEIKQTGTYYVRVGAGTDSGDTGAYRVAVSAPRTAPAAAPALVAEATPDATINRWIDENFYKGMSTLIDIKAFVFDVADETVRKMSPAQAVNTVKHIQSALKIAGVAVSVADRIDEILHPTKYDVKKTIFVEVMSLIPELALAYGPVVLPAGAVIFFIGDIVWTWKGEELFEAAAADAYDIGASLLSSRAYSNMEQLSSDDLSGGAPGDLDGLVFFDEAFYRAAYPEVDAAIAQGTIGSAYAHFLTRGIDLGYMPNAGQTLTRADLAFSIVNNDPAILGNTALFTQALGALAGDGVGSAERAVANVLAAATGPANNAALDGTLSALAHRKALDLVVNASPDPIAEAGAANSVWAASWSDGSDFGQAFNAELATVLGADAPASSYRIFAVASPTGSPADVLARLQAQEGWAPGAFDTFGIAEYGGLWVVIVADRATGATVTAPGADMLAQITVYGDAGENSMFAGTRSATLHGLDGDDRLNGAAGNDRLDSGAGNDILYLTSSASQSAPGSGTATLQPGPEGQDKWVTNVYYGGGVDDHQLKVGGWGDIYNSLVRFDLAGPGMPTHVTLATMRLYYTGSNGVTPTGMLVDRLGTAWTETYVWRDHALSYTNMLQVAAPSAVGWVDVDVTQAVNAWLADPSTNFGLQLRPTSNNNNFSFFVSSDATGDMAANRPALVLSWGPSGAPVEIDVGIGGPGNDIFIVDSANDQIIEAAGEGTDEIRTALATYSLAGLANVENLTGGAGGQALTGNDGANVLDGGAGADLMRGGAGDDAYVVDEAGDLVTELAGEGIDEVRTALGSKSDFSQLYIIPSNVENLTGTSATGQGVRDNALNNVIALGSGGDLAVMDGGGDDQVSGGRGNDYFYWGAAFNNADRADGGAGTDTLGLLGTYQIVFEADDLANIEKLALYSSGNPAAPNGYTLTMHDANLAAAQTMTVIAQSLSAGEVLSFNGAAELDGKFNVRGGKGADTITGGAGSDVIWGNLGADVLRGGKGLDLFDYNAVAESKADAADTILDFTRGDRINLARIDADGNAANGDTKFTYLGDGAFTGAAGELRVSQHPQHSRAWVVEADVNGDKVADLTIYLVGPAGFLPQAGDFIL